MADVECKHALSRHWSDKPFATLTAKHINKEAAVSVQEARRQVFSAQCGAASLKADPKHPVQMKAKQTRRKSAQMFFRDDFLKALKESHGVVNPCSKDFWSQLQQAWKELTPEAKEYYQQKARQSQDTAAQQRQQKRTAWRMQGFQGLVDILLASYG